MEVYATKSKGIGGVIRNEVEDFTVEEMLVDGSRASATDTASQNKALGASSTKGRCLLCSLTKRRWDTFSAIRAVANQLGISESRIDIAGIKDANALTSQFVTVENVSLDQVCNMKVKDLEIHPLGYVRHRLSSYYLWGNHFRIVIRGLRHTGPVIERRIAETIKQLEMSGGTPNFFGHQRFGTIRPITHLVGEAIVEGDLEKAALLFVAKPSKDENSESREARLQLLHNHDFKEALRSFPRHLRYERAMLKHLVDNPRDFLGSFACLPAKLQELFPQAYQSFLFNRFLSGRIIRGLPLSEACVGDFVIRLDRCGLPFLMMNKIVDGNSLGDVNRSIRRGKMCLGIPLVGFRQQVSEGVQGEIEQQVLDEEGISPEDFRIKEMPRLALRGALRPALSSLQEFALDETCEDPSGGSEHTASANFFLPRGSYATTFLREIMKPPNPVSAAY